MVPVKGDFSFVQFQEFFSDLEDPRRTEKGNLRHLLSDILLLTISAILCGVNGWKLVRVFGESELSWLKQYGDFSSGIPSEDTLECVFSILDPKSFNSCFINWMASFRDEIKGEVVAIDGKSMRGAKSKKQDKSISHIVSAFASSNCLVLGQIKVEEKSNEITAIPVLLDQLYLSGCTVTIDAMGCQTSIAEKIIDSRADYILAVKANQSNLQQAIKDTILLENPQSTHIWDDFGHGRIQKRTCRAFQELSHIENPEKWKGLSTLFVIDTEILVLS